MRRRRTGDYEQGNLFWDVVSTVALEVTIGAAVLAFIALLILFALPVVILW